MPKAELITQLPGVVEVRAIENLNALTGLTREDAAVGFYVVMRKKDDLFKINKWQDFSPRWMEFTQPERVPHDWLANIEQREQARSDCLREAAAEEAKRPQDIQNEWLQKAVEQTVATLSASQGLRGGALPSHEFQHGSGKPKGRPKGWRKPAVAAPTPVV